jgi:DMSO/TMAO reductase YedYZ molybdopterin-dependent catalytic subunit
MSKAKADYQRNFLTPAGSFYEVTRGKPYLLDEDARRHAGLTPETWRLEIVPDEPPWRPELERTIRESDGSALTFEDLDTLFKTHPIRCVKTMQCLMDSPTGGLCSNGFWEGVPLRDVLARVGRMRNVRRLFYTGYHELPGHRFASSLAISEVLETPPGHLPIFLAFRLNGQPLPIERGGPVRVVVPEAYGFKSIKWLRRIVLTNNYQANDTYAEVQNNDPQSPMKTLARLDVHLAQSYRRGEPILLRGVAIVGASGLERVEYWIRPDQGTHGVLSDDDPAWARAEWKEADLQKEAPRNWAEGMPGGVFPAGVIFVDPSQRPKVWPLPFSWVAWRVRLEAPEPGAYEFRVRTIDQNGFAQPEPRPNRQSGIADIPCLTFIVT